MVGFRYLALPVPLLSHLLQAAQAQEIPWPYNLPDHVKYYPEDEHLVKRDAEIQQRLQTQAPVGIRKMSNDPGQKFFFDYYTFGTEYTDPTILGNRTCALRPPLHLHATEHTHPHRRLLSPFAARSMLEKKDFTCPAGSYACSSIDRPNTCCENGSTCQLIQNTGVGDVGCCPSTESCSGTVSQCPADYTSCPQGNGCCLPGYACLDVGCVATSTAVVTVFPTPTTRTSTTTPPPPSPTTVTETSTTVIVPVPSTTSSTSPTSSITTTTTTSATSSVSNDLTCSPGFKSCPATLGGGCCPTSRACGENYCPALSSTASLTAPARPTTNSVETTVTATTSESASISTIPGFCPTGFYACSAVYQGGCCQTGRDCDTTSCPPGASTTVVDGDGVTAVAPTGSGITAVGSLLTGSCANGWSTCATSNGGGCCPSGYACGVSCTATLTSGVEATMAKIAPESGANALVVGKKSLWMVAHAAVGAAVAISITNLLM